MRKNLYNLRTNAAVEYETFILNPDGSVASHRKRKRNLILDQGLNLVATNAWCGCFNYCVVGTGTNPTKRKANPITFTRAATTVTASAGFFAPADVGRLLKLDSGEEMYITAYTSPTVVTVNISGALAASAGTIWYVNDTGLQTESTRTSIYSTGAGECGTTFSVDTYTNKRTFIFPAVGANVTYNEIGWSPNSGAGANLFGRDLIVGGDSLLTGQQYKVIVRLLLTISPVAITAAGDVGNNGFVTAGAFNHQFIGNAYSTINAAGNPVAGSLEPSIAPCCGLMAAMALNAGVSNTVDVFSAAYTIDFTNGVYTAGNFYLDSNGTAPIASGVGSIAGFFFGNAGGGIFKCLGHLFTNPQTKDNIHTLTVTLRKSWGRVLVN
jgi:hypothetical protein